MKSNPILDELHSVREKLLADAGGDLHRLVEEANQRALESGRQILDSTVLRREREQRDRELAQQSAVILPISMPVTDQTSVPD